MQYDTPYTDQRSFGLDLRILVKTVFAIIRQAAYANQAIELEHALEASEQQPAVAVTQIELRPDLRSLKLSLPIEQEIS